MTRSPGHSLRLREEGTGTVLGQGIWGWVPMPGVVVSVGGRRLVVARVTDSPLADHDLWLVVPEDRRTEQQILRERVTDLEQQVKRLRAELLAARVDARGHG